MASTEFERRPPWSVIRDGGLEIRLNRNSETCLIELLGELDLANASSVERELRLAEEGGPIVVLDLANLEFIDSTGIELLVRAARRSQANGHALVLTRVRGPVEQTMKLCGLDRLLPALDGNGRAP